MVVAPPTLQSKNYNYDLKNKFHFTNVPRSLKRFRNTITTPQSPPFKIQKEERDEPTISTQDDIEKEDNELSCKVFISLNNSPLLLHY